MRQFRWTKFERANKDLFILRTGEGRGRENKENFMYSLPFLGRENKENFIFTTIFWGVGGGKIKRFKILSFFPQKNGRENDWLLGSFSWQR